MNLQKKMKEKEFTHLRKRMDLHKKEKIVNLHKKEKRTDLHKEERKEKVFT